MLQLGLYPAVTPCLGKSVIVEAWPQMLKRKQLHMCVCLRIDETGIRLTVPSPWVKYKAIVHSAKGLGKGKNR